jgi:hypothetical protein
MNPEQLLKVHRTSEKLWLGISVAAVILSGYFIWRDGLESSKYLWLPGIAIVYYFFRRHFRKRMERQIEDQKKRS